MSRLYAYPNNLLTIKKGGEDYMKHIVAVVCKHWGCTPAQLRTKTNARDYSEPFHVAATLIVEFTMVDRNDIAAMFNRKRSMTYHAQKAVSNLEFSDLRFREKMRTIRAKLSQTFYDLQNQIVINDKELADMQI